MGSLRDVNAPPMIDVDVPEYYITDVVVEPAGGQNLRLYCCVLRGETLIPVYRVIMPIDKLTLAARLSLHAAADVHNELQFFHPPPSH